MINVMNNKCKYSILYNKKLFLSKFRELINKSFNSKCIDSFLSSESLDNTKIQNISSF